MLDKVKELEQWHGQHNKYKDLKKKWKGNHQLLYKQ